MAYGRNWWEDASFLKIHNIESHHNVMSNAVQFRKSFAFEGDQMLRYAQMSVDEYDLRDGHIRIEDVNRELGRIIRGDDEFRHQGPTNAQLRHPSIYEAWESLQILIRLIGVNK